MPVYDLHSHSTASDGVLSPVALVHRAIGQGVDFLALTDHDELAGLAAAQQAASGSRLRLVQGVEVSITWHRSTVHIVGLHVDPREPILRQGLARNRAGRRERAQRMADALARIGIPGALEGAYAHAVNKDLIGRTHFARFLVETGVVKDVKTVFTKYLVQGRPGYVPHEWASLREALNWIHAAGGQAVLAHPGRYRFGGEKLRLLLSEFRDFGGEGMEVITGSHGQDQVPLLADLAVRHGLLASVGSDFHAPGEGGRELGSVQGKPMRLPERCTPIWSRW
ncbi:MAG TPA: 3',5'-nucleoside bisphosphate phosphatase [Thiobacillaceae bacterium]|nr:3',5'-nucleoside bisphosphate phosphatase [Thiobacillaceae bacterium]HNU63001.1 3',5'-nucleoside bisphosphate phosphatase [Thiobacillaceae bacterium]